MRTYEDYEIYIYLLDKIFFWSKGAETNSQGLLQLLPPGMVSTNIIYLVSSIMVAFGIIGKVAISIDDFLVFVCILDSVL